MSKNHYKFSFFNRRSPMLWGAIALALTLGACGETAPSADSDAADTADTTDTAASSEALKIGTLLPITGDLAQYGGPMQDSATLLVETVNGCGGVLGQPVQLISEDDQTDPAAGAAAMSKLAEVDQVSGVVGAAASSVSSAAVDIAVRNQVVEISPSATSPVFTEQAKAGDFDGYWFRTAPPDTFQGQALAQLAMDQGYETVAVIAINNDYGSGLVQSFAEAYTALGGTVVNQDNPTLYPPDASSFDSEVSSVFNGSPDAVLLVAYPETGSLILQAAFEQGFLDGETQVLLTDGMKDASIAELVGKDSDGSFVISGVMGTAPSAGGPGLEQFTAIYNDAFNRDPSVFDPNTWDATALIALAAEAAGDTSGTAIRDAIRNVANAPGTEVTDVCEALELIRQGEDINYQGASGPVDLDDQGDVVGSYDIWTVGDDGAIQVQETIEIGG
ncbi:ABC transporter substrate-binding protein [Leptolyngbya sp. CCY15150]|uniref:ABC transporter substrate-binding protein n=1 Tax=Leptolyngbya sp. CCY15150 TaxID=2767772 RepID=UPI001EF3BA49|nr:ABC transporter substrate-binding protein [Leptolyngbya sp. CCY15150]